MVHPLTKLVTLIARKVSSENQLKCILKCMFSSELSFNFLKDTYVIYISRNLVNIALVIPILAVWYNTITQEVS